MEYGPERHDRRAVSGREAVPGREAAAGRRAVPGSEAAAGRRAVPGNGAGTESARRRRRRRRRKRRQRIAILTILLVCLFLTAAALVGYFVVWPYLQEAEMPPQTGRRYVWDSTLLDTDLTTAPLVQNAPVRRELALRMDQPWESGSAGGFNIVPCDEGYLLYYVVSTASGEAGVCCAQSRDGIVWDKTPRGEDVVTDGGSAQNNILFYSADAVNGFFAFCDTSRNAGADDRYKALAVNDAGRFTAYVSPDGLHWTAKAALDGKLCTSAKAPAALCSVFWNDAAGRYYCYYIAQQDGQQTVMLSTSRNFKSWSKPKAIACQAGAVRQDLQTAYILPYGRGGQMLVGLPLRATATDGNAAGLPDGGAASAALTDAVFLASANGTDFQLGQEAWLTPGPQNGSNWVYGDCFAAGGLIRTPSLHAEDGEDDELSFYVAEDLFSGAAGLARYTMRLDGFAACHAPYATKKVVTVPLELEGDHMTVNFRTSTDGYVYVRILDENGAPFEDVPCAAPDGTVYTQPAYTSYKLIGDRADREVVFNKDIAALAGKTVVLEFYLSDADLYSFQFDSEPYQTDVSNWKSSPIEMREETARQTSADGGTVEIGGQRQVFWDDWLTDAEKTDASLAAYAPVRREAVLRTDQPWEGDNCDFYVILEDEDGDGRLFYRMYYLGWDSDDPVDIRVCYAYSYDGTEWIRPDLGLHSYTDKTTGEVYEQTNIMLYTEDFFDNFFVIKDTRAGVPDSERYKAICEGRTDTQGFSSYGLWAWASADGLHWRKVHRQLPQLEEWFGAFDSVNGLVWDDASGQFFTYFRVREPQYDGQIEWPDFRKIYGAVAPAFQPVDTGTIFSLDYGPDAPLFEMYTNNISKYYRAPQMFIGFPTRFSRNNMWQKNYEYLGDPQARRTKFEAGQETRTLSMTDTMFMISRDGYVWNRRSEAFLTPGPEHLSNWIYGNCYPAYGLIETAAGVPGADNEISLYLFEGKFYHIPSVLYRYTLRLDGFGCYRGGSVPQKVTTRPLTFTGSALEVNFRTSAAGSVQVNLLDESGRPIAGYGSGRLVGDDTNRTVVFEQDLAPLNGVPVRLEFVLCDAEVYSFQFLF